MSWRFRLCRQSFGRWARHRAARCGARRQDTRLRTTAVGLRIAFARMFPAGQRSNPAPRTLVLECWRRAEKEIPGRRAEDGAKRSSCEPTIAQSRLVRTAKTTKKGQRCSVPSLDSSRPLVVAVHGLAGCRIQNQALVAAMAEIKHIQQRSRRCIGRSAAYLAGSPVVFDEAQDRRLIGKGAVYEVSLG